MSTWTVEYVRDNGLRYLAPAFERVFGRPANFYELAFALSQSHMESSWGRAWKPPCDTSFNWGAVQSTTSAGCDYTDSDENGRYEQKFVVYPSHDAGAEGYLHQAYVRRPKALGRATAGDLDGFVRELYRTSYFTGTACAERSPSGKCIRRDDEKNIAAYRAALSRRLPDIEHALEALGYERPPSSAAPSWAARSAIAVAGVAAGATAGYAAHRFLPRPRSLTPNRRALARRWNMDVRTVAVASTALLATSALIWYLTRRTRTATVRLKAGDRLALVGDSLGVGLSPHLARLAAASGYPLTSAVQTGSTMAYWLPRLGTLLSSRPTVVLVSLGTNDAYTQTSLPELEAQLRQLLAQVQASGARVVWIGPPTLPDAARPEVLALLRRVPAYFHSEQLSIPQHDGIHSTADGYRDWAAAIWEDLT